LQFDLTSLVPYAGALVAGARLSALACALALAGSLVLGTLVALMRTAASKLARRLAGIYVDVFRNVPFIVQLFFLFYGLPEIGIELGAFTTGVLALSLAGGAFTSDAIRSGILAIEPGILEAAQVSGLSRMAIYRRIVLPIALRSAVRPLGSVFVNLILTSSDRHREDHRRRHLPALRGVRAAAGAVCGADLAGVAVGRRAAPPPQSEPGVMRFTDFTSHDLVLLLQGLGVSFALFAATTVIGLAIGLAWALLRWYRVPLLAQLAALLAELLKNSPVLVQLFLVFFGLPVLLETDLTPVQAALITLSGNTAAFVYVIAVSAIESVGRDQLETARVFGLSRWQALRRVVLPQAAAFALGPLTGLLVNQLQVTSLISVIGVVDLTKAGAILNLRTLKPFIVWTVIGVLYYLMARLIAAACARLETRLRAHREWKGL